MSETLTYTITPEMVHGEGWQEKIPAGQRIKRFGPPLEGDDYLYRQGVVTSVTDFAKYEPRIILEPVPVTEYVFRSTGEKRAPKKGEWFVTMDGHFIRAYSDYDELTEKEIFTCEVREVQP